jgi:serine protein kinase
MDKRKDSVLVHLQEVQKGNRRFENAAQGVSRMILEKPVTRMTHAGKTIYDFEFFREGEKHIIGWYDQKNAFVHFVRDAARGGSAKAMAFILVGEPGNGKTFFVNYVCEKYRQFLSRPDILLNLSGLIKPWGMTRKYLKCIL